MLVHGGRTAPDQPLGDLWLLDLSAKLLTGQIASWIKVDAQGMPPAPRHRHSSVAIGGSLKVRCNHTEVVLPVMLMKLHAALDTAAQIARPAKLYFLGDSWCRVGG